jgi:hypothetical protein
LLLKERKGIQCFRYRALEIMHYKIDYFSASPNAMIEPQVLCRVDFK